MNRKQPNCNTLPGPLVAAIQTEVGMSFKSMSLAVCFLAAVSHGASAQTERGKKAYR